MASLPDGEIPRASQATTRNENSIREKLVGVTRLGRAIFEGIVQKIGHMGINDTIKGEVIVFMGAGKGKTAAALGVSCRSVAHGGKVIFVYFNVARRAVLHELKATSEFGDSWKTVNVKSRAKNASLGGFSESIVSPAAAIEKAREKWLYECNLLVLDDIAYHLDRGTISVEQVIALIHNRPPKTSLIFTGDSMPQPIIDEADLVTEFRKIK